MIGMPDEVVGYQTSRIAIMMLTAAAALTSGSYAAEAACDPGGPTPGFMNTFTCGTGEGSVGANFDSPANIAAVTNVGVTVNGNLQSPFGDRAIGVGPDSVVVNNGEIKTGGNNGFGILAVGNGTSASTIINNGEINTFSDTNSEHGNGAMGISVGDVTAGGITPNTAPGSTVVNTGAGVISVAGNNAAGIRTLSPDTTIVNNGTITAAGLSMMPTSTVPGNFAAGVLFQNGSSGTFINLPNGMVSSQNDAAVHVATDGVTITNFGMLTGDTGTAVILSGDKNILNQAAGTITGNIVMDTGANTVNASGGQIIGAMLTQSGTSTATLTNGALWQMTGSSNLTTLIDNGGNISFKPPTGDPTQLSSYKTLTVNTLTGSAGGEIVMNTFLASDNSPSDRIVVTSTATTMSQSLLFTNTNPSGIGAGTTMNGILVVQAESGATTAANAFMLNGQARSGSTYYMLFRGAPDGDPAFANDWFLRSVFFPPEPPAGPGPFVPAPPNGVLPPSPPIGDLQPGVPYPITGPELATYGVVQPIAREMGLSTLGTLHERLGDSPGGTCCCTAVTTCCSATSEVKTPSGARETETTVTKTAVTSSGDCNGPATWGRVIGQSVDNRYQAYADPQAKGEIVGFQGGVDLWRGSLIPGHTDTAGIYFGYANANIDVTGIVTNGAATAYQMSHVGTMGLNGYSAGGYWTHYGPTGWYVDAVVQGTWYDGDASTQFASLPLRGSGIVTSLEGGYPIPLPWRFLGPHFVLEPEAQIIWQQVSFAGENDGIGPVNLGTTSGFTGRLGLRGTWTLAAANGAVWQPYVQANVWRDWNAEADTVFGVDPVPLLEQATRLEFLGGVTVKLATRFSVFAQGGYQFATNESDQNPYRRDSIKGDLGVRYTW